MDLLDKVSLGTLLLHWLVVSILLLIVFWAMMKIVAWGKTMSRGAFYFCRSLRLFRYSLFHPRNLRMYKKPNKSNVNAKKTPAIHQKRTKVKHRAEILS